MHDEGEVIKPMSHGEKVQIFHVWLALVEVGYTLERYEKFQQTHVHFKFFIWSESDWVQSLLLRLTDCT